MHRHEYETRARALLVELGTLEQHADFALSQATGTPAAVPLGVEAGAITCAVDTSKQIIRFLGSNESPWYDEGAMWHELVRLLRWWIALFTKPGPAVTVRLIANLKGQSMSPVALPLSDVVTLKIEGADANGNPSLTGVTVGAWTVDLPTVGTLVVAADALSATVVGVEVGTVIVTVPVTLADASVVELTESLDVAPGVAVTVSLVADTPAAPVVPVPVPAV